MAGGNFAKHDLSTHVKLVPANEDGFDFNPLSGQVIQKGILQPYLLWRAVPLPRKRLILLRAGSLQGAAEMAGIPDAAWGTDDRFAGSFVVSDCRTGVGSLSARLDSRMSFSSLKALMRKSWV
ncbi:MAG TPA: hypothetical protein VMU48_18150 [Terracidiphilus sp.]|nr:hypothetical protein [Terracidiphilus sp.]